MKINDAVILANDDLKSGVAHSIGRPGDSIAPEVQQA